MRYRVTMKEMKRINALLSQSGPLGEDGAAELRALLDKLHGRKPPQTSRMTLNGDTITFALETGGNFIGTETEVNALLRAMGFREIAVRNNMMSRKPYIEAKDTPLYCSPSSESYWSM